jgi:RNA polymerase sigma factor for flagellar operon FliA
MTLSAAPRHSATHEQLAERHLNLVYHIAQSLARTLSTEADVEELISAGTLGLIGAVEAFDASRGLAFSTFAVPRIRGAMLDELRRVDPVTRSVRRKSRDIRGAREKLQRSFGRPASDGEVAETLGIDKPTLWRWEADVDASNTVPLDRPRDDDDRRSASAWELNTADQSPSIDELLTGQAEKERLTEALAELKEQERVVLTLYYFEELKMHEIAEVLGVTESRVSQIRARALKTLRSSLAGLRD